LSIETYIQINIIKEIAIRERRFCNETRINKMKTFTTTMYLSLFVVLNIIVSSSVVVLGNELQDTQGGTQSITYLFGSA